MAAKQLKVTDILERVQELPTLPAIVYEIRAVIDNPMSSTADVEKVMENDPSLTTKVLKLVNSAYYSIPGGVTQLSRAIAYLGFDTVHQLVLSASIIDTLKTEHNPNFNIADFWKHSLGAAIASETIANFVKYPVPADLFTCGLVHDIGKIALYTIDSELMMNVIEKAYDEKITYLESEKALGIPTHTHIGFALAQKWKLPMGFQSVVKYHHHKTLTERESMSSDLHLMIDIVYLGNLLSHALKFGNSGHPVIHGAPKEVLNRLSLDSPDKFRILLQLVKNQIEHADSFLDILGARS